MAVCLDIHGEYLRSCHVGRRQRALGLVPGLCDLLDVHGLTTAHTETEIAQAPSGAIFMSEFWKFSARPWKITT